MDYTQALINLIKKPQFYIPRGYQSIGGMWTVDTWERDGVKVLEMDEGYSTVITAEGLEVIDLYFNNRNHSIFRVGTEDTVKAIVDKFSTDL